MKMRRWYRLAVVGSLVLSPVMASAQVTPPGGQRQRMEMERRLQQGMQRTLQNQLGLDEATMRSVQSVMQSFQQDRQSLNRDQASLRYRLRDPGLPNLSEEDARAMLQEMVTLQERELDLYKREQSALSEYLTPVQLVRFYRFREELGLRVQQLRQGRGMGGGVGGGLGMGGGMMMPPPGTVGGGGVLFR